MASALRTSCVTRHEWEGDWQVETQAGETDATVTATASLSGPLSLTKWNVYTDTLRHEQMLVDTGIQVQESLKHLSFEDMLEQQEHYLADFWKRSDVVIENDLSLQEGIRFNLYQLLQSAGRDAHSNISAKGLSGEGYEGHYFWDTEIYMFPVFLMTSPDLARQLLLYRYSKLEEARERAKEMGHAQGALFPWRTISGTECSSFFPSGTAQYHISADVAYSYIQYHLAEEDDTFLLQYGAEVLFETARLWMEIGHYYEGKFHIDEVTGPDEYTCLVNNNYYTNVMAKHNLKWAARSFARLQEYDEAAFQALCVRLHVTGPEADSWLKAANAMLLPYDEKLGINPQDDTFYAKQSGISRIHHRRNIRCCCITTRLPCTVIKSASKRIPYWLITCWKTSSRKKRFANRMIIMSKSLPMTLLCPLAYLASWPRKSDTRTRRITTLSRLHDWISIIHTATPKTDYISLIWVERGWPLCTVLPEHVLRKTAYRSLRPYLRAGRNITSASPSADVSLL